MGYRDFWLFDFSDTTTVVYIQFRGLNICVFKVFINCEKGIMQERLLFVRFSYLGIYCMYCSQGGANTPQFIIQQTRIICARICYSSSVGDMVGGGGVHHQPANILR